MSSMQKIFKETWFMQSDINETRIAGNSLLLDIIVQELAQWSRETPSFNLHQVSNLKIVC